MNVFYVDGVNVPPFKQLHLNDYVGWKLSQMYGSESAFYNYIVYIFCFKSSVDIFKRDLNIILLNLPMFRPVE